MKDYLYYFLIFTTILSFNFQFKDKEVTKEYKIMKDDFNNDSNYLYFKTGKSDLDSISEINFKNLLKMIEDSTNLEFRVRLQYYQSDSLKSDLIRGRIDNILSIILSTNVNLKNFRIGFSQQDSNIKTEDCFFLIIQLNRKENKWPAKFGKVIQHQNGRILLRKSNISNPLKKLSTYKQEILQK